MCECVAFFIKGRTGDLPVKIKFCGEGDSQKCGRGFCSGWQGFADGLEANCNAPGAVRKRRGAMGNGIEPLITLEGHVIGLGAWLSRF